MFGSIDYRWDTETNKHIYFEYKYMYAFRYSYSYSYRYGVRQWIKQVRHSDKGTYVQRGYVDISISIYTTKFLLGLCLSLLFRQTQPWPLQWPPAAPCELHPWGLGAAATPPPVHRNPQISLQSTHRHLQGIRLSAVPRARGRRSCP